MPHTEEAAHLVRNPPRFVLPEEAEKSRDGANEIAFVCRPPQLAEHTAWSTTVACYTLDIRGAQQAAAAKSAQDEYHKHVAAALALKEEGKDYVKDNSNMIIL